MRKPRPCSGGSSRQPPSVFNRRSRREPLACVRRRRASQIRGSIQSENGHRLAIINKTAGIGDVIAMRYLLRSVSEAHPELSIDLVLPEGRKNFIIDHPCCSRVLTPFFFKPEQFSTIYDLTGVSERHLDRNRILVWADKLGCSISDPSPELIIEEVDKRRAMKIIRNFSPNFRPVILVCPYGSNPHKQLRIEAINALVRILEDFGWCPLILHDSEILGVEGKFLTELNFRMWAAIFSISDAVITVPTSHLWVSSCLNKPTIGLFGPEPIEAYKEFFPNLVGYQPNCDKVCLEPQNCDSDKICLNPSPEKIISILGSMGIKSLKSSGGKSTGVFSKKKLVGVRVQGLLGDAIKVSSVISALPSDVSTVVMLSYKDVKKHEWIKNLYSNLILENRIDRIIESPYLGSGRIRAEEIDFLKSLGCSEIYDGNVLSDEFLSYRRTAPDLGLDIHEPIRGRVCLMRRSHLHHHFPLRNRPYEEWREIEEYLLELGYRPEILGLDDPMPNDFGLPDYRGLLTPLQTLQRTIGAELIISTVTFVPVFTNHFRTTLVLSDPRDIGNLVTKWYDGNFAKVFDVAKPYLEEIKGTIRDISNNVLPTF